MGRHAKDHPDDVAFPRRFHRGAAPRRPGRPTPEPPWSATSPAEVAALRAVPGGDLTLGGADLAASFLRHDLVDEYRIYVHPVRIGRGKPLFPPTDAPVPLRLEEARAFGNGVVLPRYARG